MVMERYYFLFALAALFCIFAVVFDLKKREVPNWLNFSLIAFALAYRAFFAVRFSDWMFFVYGLIGLVMFVALGNLFYYTKVFAGGDAKLLMGLAVCLPMETWNDFISIGLGLIILMCFVGAVYSLIYSFFIGFGKNYSLFKKKFLENLKMKKSLLLFSFILAFVLICFSVYAKRGMIGMLFALFIIFISFLYVYLKAIDSCMIKLTNYRDLTEGDWILNDIKLKGYVVKKTVHGLTIEDIKKLRKAKKKIFVKTGIPFTPAIFISFVLMVFFLAVLGLRFDWVFLLLR